MAIDKKKLKNLDLWGKDDTAVTTTTGKTYKMSQVGTKNYTVNQQKAAENKAAMAKAEQVHQAAQAKAQQQQKAQQKAQIKTTAADRVKQSLLSMPEMRDYTRESVQPDKYDTTPGTLPKIKNVLRRADNAGASILAKQLGSKEAAIKTAAIGVKSKATSLLGGNESDRYKRQMSALSSKYGVRAAAMPEYKLAQLNYNNALAKEKIKSRQDILKATKSADDYKTARNAALDGLTGGKRTAANFLMGAGDMGADIALLGATGAVGGAAAMGLGAMGDKARQVALKGGTVDDAVKAGLLSGGVSAAVNYVVPKALGKVGALAPKALPTYRNSILAGEDLIRSGNSGYISGLKGLNSELAKTVLSNAAKEGVHGSAFGVANTLGQGAANALLGEQTGITPGSLAREAGTGFIMGAGMGGIRGGIGAYGASRGNKAYAEGFADEYNKHYDELRGDLRKGLLDRQVQQTPLMLGTTKGTLGEKIVNDAKNTPLLIGTTKPKFEPDFYANGNGSIFSADAEGTAAYENSHNIPRTPLLEGDITNPNVDFVVGSAGTVETNNATDYANAVNQFNNKTESERQAARNLYANRARMATEYGLPNNLGEGFVNPTDPIAADTDPRSTIKYYSDGKGQVTLFDVPYEGIEEPSGHYPIYNGRQLLRSDRTPDYAASKGTKEEFSRRNIIDNRKNIINNRPPENEPTANEPYPVYDGKQSLVGGKTLGGKINNTWAKINAERNTTPGELPTGTAPKTENITANSKANTVTDTTPGNLPKSKIKSEPQPTEAYNTRRNRQAGNDYDEFKASNWEGLSREEVNKKIIECNKNIEALDKEITKSIREEKKEFRGGKYTEAKSILRHTQMLSNSDEIDYQKEMRDSLFMYRDSLDKRATGTKQRNTTPGELPTYGKGTVGAAEAKATEPQMEIPESAVKGIEGIENGMKSTPPTKQIKDVSNPNNLGFADMTLTTEGNKILQKARKAYQTTVSGQAPLERMDSKINKIIKKANKNGANIEETPEINEFTQLVRQAGGTTDTILEKALYDSTGEKVSDTSFESLVRNVPKEVRGKFNTYLQESHNIARQAQNKPVTSHTADESRQIVADLEKYNPDFKKYKTDLQNYWKEFGQKWYVDTGLLTQEQFDNFQKMYPDYIPTFRVDKSNALGGIAGKKVHTPNAVGKAKGSIAEVLPFEESFPIKINQAVKAVRKNDLYKAIGDTIEQYPEEMAKMGVVKGEVTKETLESYKTLFDEGANDTLKELGDGNFSLSYYKNGEKHTLRISKDVFSAMRLLDNATGIENELLKSVIVGMRKTTSPLKASITGSNPVFALANVMRDWQTYYMNTIAKNPIQATSNLFKAFATCLADPNNAALGEYHAMGNNRSGFYNAKDGMTEAMKVKTPFNEKSLWGKFKYIAATPVRGINKLNGVTEEATRYAEYLNGKQIYGDTPSGRRKASLAAADVTVNFSRNAPATYVADSGTLYLNAGVQGLDKTARQFKTHPIQTVLRGAAGLTIMQLMANFFGKDNPYYQELDQTTKDRYVCFGNPFDTDKKTGYAKTFIKIPKAEAYGALFCSLADRTMKYIETGDSETAYKGFGNVIKTNLLPSNPFSENLPTSILTELENNKDFAGRNIVSPTFINGNVPPQYQYDAKTSGAARAIANVANNIPLPNMTLTNALKSPQQTDYLLGQLGFVGSETKALTSPKNQGENWQETLKNTLYNAGVDPYRQRFIADPVYNNKYTDELYDAIDKTKEEVATDVYSGKVSSKAEKTGKNFAETSYNYASGLIKDIRTAEQDILNSKGAYKDKDAKLKEGRTKMAAIAKKTLEEIPKMQRTVDNTLKKLDKNSDYAALSQDDKNKVRDSIIEYYNIKSKKAINSEYENTGDAKFDNMLDAGVPIQDAAVYKYNINKTISQAKEDGLSQHKQKIQAADYINSLGISANQKKVLENNYISDVQIIGDDIDFNYSGSKTDYEASKLSESGQSFYSNVKQKGYTLEIAEKALDIMNTTSADKGREYKKTEKLSDMQKQLGLTKTQAEYLWNAKYKKK